jgi:hypothetical protein
MGLHGVVRETSTDPGVCSSRKVTGRSAAHFSGPSRRSPRLTVEADRLSCAAIDRTLVPARCRSAICRRSSRHKYRPEGSPASRLAPTPPSSSIHSHSLARRDQRPALGHQHPELGLPCRSVPSSTTCATPHNKRGVATTDRTRQPLAGRADRGCDMCCRRAVSAGITRSGVARRR